MSTMETMTSSSIERLAGLIVVRSKLCEGLRKGVDDDDQGEERPSRETIGMSPRCSWGMSNNLKTHCYSPEASYNKTVL